MKDMTGAALLGELIARLSRSSILWQALSGMSAGDADSVIGRIVQEAERLASQSVTSGAAQAAQAPEAEAPPAVRPVPGTQAATPASPTAAPSQHTPPASPRPATAGVTTGAPAERPAPVAASSEGPAQRPAPAAASSEVPAQRPAPAAPSSEGHAQRSAPAAASAEVSAQRPAAAAASSEVPAQRPAPAAVSSGVPASRPVTPVQPSLQAPPARAVVESLTPSTTSRLARGASEPSRTTVDSSRDGAASQRPAPGAPVGSPFGHTPFPFEDERAYVIAASLIPLNDTPSPHPFRLGGQGLDEGSELFAVDHAGMRFYLSLLNNQDASVSKSGALLLNKQQGLFHRGNHERLVNQLRLRGMILPAESGTIVRGNSDLVRRIDFRLHALLEILLGLSTTTTWHLQVSVLDSRVQHTLPPEAGQPRTGRQEREGVRGVGSHKRTDIKALDRLLTREKKLAETILQSIASAAERHDLDYLIGLAGGSSDGWKVILKATFQVPPKRYPRFAEAVAACQEMHALIGPMFVLSGGAESFSLSM